MNAKILFFLFLLVSHLGLVGCRHSAGLDPKTVAEHFWSAVKTGELEKARPYVTRDSFDALKENREKNQLKGEYILGEVTIENDTAVMDTTLTDQGIEIPMKTYLVKEGGQWKVEVSQTMMSMLNNVGEIMRRLGEAMGKALTEGLKGLGEGLKAGMKGMEGAVKELEKSFPPPKEKEKEKPLEKPKPEKSSSPGA